MLKMYLSKIQNEQRSTMNEVLHTFGHSSINYVFFTLFCFCCDIFRTWNSYTDSDRLRSCPGIYMAIINARAAFTVEREFLWDYLYMLTKGP